MYHYTTQQGLLGIVRDKEIWASHTQYLNDVREFRHALELVKEELSAKRQAAADEFASKCLVAMQETIDSGMESVNVCVCSFSEQGDSLSQWRAYGGAASGFAIGFSGTSLRKISDDQQGWLAPVVYDEVKQRILVRKLLDDVLEENRKVLDNQEPRPTGGNLGAYLSRYAPILKHKSFQEEREWRIITRPLLCTGDRFGYRPGASMLIPYYRLPLADQKWLGIREIIIGPTPHADQSHNSVGGLLLKNDCRTYGILPDDDFVAIRSSEVPYRSW